MAIDGDPGLIVAGIDPGIRGALAVLNENNDCDTASMPVMGDPAIVDGAAVARWLHDRDVQLVIIEQSQAMPLERKVRGKTIRQGISSTFRTGQTYGQLLGVLQASLLPYRPVTAQVWKRAMGLNWEKERSRRRAIELRPAISDQFARKLDEARAEAALLAWWYLHGRTPVVEPRPKTEELVA